MSMKTPDIDTVHKAIMRRSLSDVTYAIAQGADVDAPDRENRTPLFYAVRDGATAIVAELIRLGADVNAQDKNLETPLHFASRGHWPDVAELLLKNGADVDSKDSQGNTPLSRAVFESKGRGQVIKLLLSFGANSALKNNHGVSPEDRAKSIANYDLSAFFSR